jgi:DNA-binding CsgD family transcriptional regulator/PAS domain-containing protein
MATLLQARSTDRKHDILWSHWANREAALPAPVEPNDELTALLATIIGTVEADAILATLHSDRGGESPLILGIAGGDSLADEDWAQLATLAQASERRLLPANAQLSDYDWTTVSTGLRVCPLLRVSIASHRAGSRIVLTILYSAGRPAGRAGASLESLRPVIDAYFRLWQRDRLLGHRNAGLAAALDTVQTAVVLIARSGRICHVNSTARELLERGDYLRRSDETLAAEDLADGVALQVAVNDAVATNGGSETRRRAPVIALRSPLHDRPMVLTVVPCEQRARESADLAAIVYAVDPESDYTEQMQAVCKVYGLSQVETRLVLLISGGASLQKAAESLRIKEQTARSSLKQVFLKTDTRRQADLVRVILSSLLPLRTSLTVQAIDHR